MKESVNKILWNLELCREHLAAAASGVAGKRSGASEPQEPSRMPPAPAKARGRQSSASSGSSSGLLAAAVAAVENSLQRVKRAVTAASPASGSGSGQPWSATAPAPDVKLESMEREAAEAASVLMADVNALAAAKGGSRDHDHVAAAAAAQALITRIAQSLATTRQQLAMRAAAEAQAAVAAGDADAAMRGALAAQEDVAAAIWAARVGGVQATTQMVEMQRAAMQALEATLALRERLDAAAKAAAEDGTGSGEAAPGAAPAPDEPLLSQQPDRDNDLVVVSEQARRHTPDEPAACVAAATAAAAAEATDSTGNVEAAAAAASDAASAPAGASPTGSGGSDSSLEECRNSTSSSTSTSTSQGDSDGSSVSSNIGSSNSGSSSTSPTPQLPPRFPRVASAAYDDTNPVSRALSRLAALADEATPEGRLPAAALSRVAGVCAKALRAPPHGWEVASKAAWSNPNIRGRLAAVLSYILRQLQACVASGDASSVPVPGGGCAALAVLLRSLQENAAKGSDGQAAAHTAWSPEVHSVVLELLLRMDTIQSVTGLIAALDAAAGASPATEADSSDSEEEEEEEEEEEKMRSGAGAELAATATEGPAPHRGLSASDLGRLQLSLAHFLMPLVHACCPHSPLEPLPCSTAALRELRGALLRCRVLEHAARWAVTAASKGAAGGGSARRKERVETRLWLLVTALTDVLSPSPTDDAATAVWARVAVSGPCVQYFLLLHAVSQLCAVDGGPDYGLGSGARLPPMIRARVPNPGGEAAGGSWGLVWADLMAYSFRWWAENWAHLDKSCRPCPDRALKALCARAAAVATASAYRDETGSVAVIRGPNRAAEAAAEAAAPEAAAPGALRNFFSPPRSAMRLACMALECAVAVARGGGNNAAVGDCRGLWAPAVQAANAALHVLPAAPRIPNTPALADEWAMLQLLVTMPRPPLAAAETGGLPSQPGPQLAAALEAGYVPALERVIRHNTRGANVHSVKPVLESVRSLLLDVKGLAALMAYGEPAAVASLLATCGKVLATAIHIATAITSASGAAANSAAVAAVTRCGSIPRTLHGFLGELSETVQRESNWDGRGSGPADRLWWRLDGGVSAPLAPLHQLSLLTTFAAARWLPAIHGFLDPASANGASCHRKTILLWVPPLVQAYLHCKTQDTAADGGGASGGASTSAGTSAAARRNSSRSAKASASAAAAAGSATGAEAASWERLLLGALDLPGLLQRAARAAAWQEGQDLGNLPSVFAAALLHLLVAFPRQAREVVRTRLGAGARRKTILLVDWLRGALAASGDPLDDVCRHCLDLAAAVAGGADPGEEDLARLRDEGGESGVAARLGALLPPPCVAAAVLGLPTCANPGCANLEGDSEAGLMAAAGRKVKGGAFPFPRKSAKGALT
ncbi:hypothetical protein PLESTM_001451200 [Pleodorina starrii]|nr:hypothetical protein PLESTM_001451200 [Pleodorina starrii]